MAKISYELGATVSLPGFQNFKVGLTITEDVPPGKSEAEAVSALGESVFRSLKGEIVARAGDLGAFLGALHEGMKG